jgi:hypothetical protein
MRSSPANENPEWNVESLSLPVGLSAKKPLPRHRPGEPFIKGPIPYDWLAAACNLPGSGLHVAMMYQFLCCRYPSPNRWGLEKIAKGLGLGERTARRALHAAEMAGLLVVDREPGCKLAVSIGTLSARQGAPARRPLYGPIPMSWWLPASRLPGKALHVAAVCWLLAGWERSAEFSLSLSHVEPFGLGDFDVARGLTLLRESRLVDTRRTRSREPHVTTLNAPPLKP